MAVEGRSGPDGGALEEHLRTADTAAATAAVAAVGCACDAMTSRAPGDA